VSLPELSAEFKARVLSGRDHFLNDRPAEALREFQSALTERPRSERLSFAIFHCLWDLDRRVEALDEVKRFVGLTGSTAYKEIIDEINEKYRDG